MLRDAVGAVLRPADLFERQWMLEILLAVQLLGFILGASAFLLRHDHADAAKHLFRQSAQEATRAIAAGEVERPLNLPVIARN